MENERKVGGQISKEELYQNAYDYRDHSFPEENYLEGFDLHHYRYPAVGKTKGVVFFFHDQSRYLGKYAHIAEHFSKKEIEVVGFDLPGHGKNKGKPRGYFGSYYDVNQYAKKFIKETMDKFDYHNKVPKFSIGVSTGALTTLSLALEDKKLFNGISVVCPLLKNDGAHPRFYRYSDFLGKAFPKLGLMSVNIKKAQPFPDPLLFKGKLKAGLFKELDDVSFYIRNNAHKLSVPILVAHGGLDTITKPLTVRDYFKEIDTEDKDIILYDD